MLSDEEKKVIEYTKEEYKKGKEQDNVLFPLYLYQAEIIINLIEKQSKEIEELKKNNGYHLGFIDGGIAKKYEIQDKIKAKIEELKDGTFDAKIVLQSLLEKE